jgi:MYXO-CTERM domain-containing protein
LQDFPTPSSVALIIDTPVLGVSNAPEQPVPATHAAGAAGELVGAAFRLNALNGAATVNGITFTTSGTGDWSSDVNAATGVAVYRDNGDGVYSATDDTLLDETGGASPIVTSSFNLTLTTGEIADLWVVIRLTPTAGQGVAATPETFIVSINDPGTDVSATIPATAGMPAPNGVAVGAVEFNVSSFNPASALQAGTQPITITGSGFMMPFTVVIGGTVCPGTPAIAGGTQVTGLSVPPGVGVNLPIIVHSGNLPPQTLAQTFTYTSPKDNDPPKSDDGGSRSVGSSPAWAVALAMLGVLVVARRRRTT